MQTKTKNPPNIKYIGKIPVRMSGNRGEIQPGQALYIPEEKVKNLILDKENWQRLNPVNTNTIAHNTLTDELLAPLEEPPAEEKKKKKKEKDKEDKVKEVNDVQ